MEYNTCHKCGRKIVTSFDEASIEAAGDVWKALEVAKKNGYANGYVSKTVGYMGNMYQVPIKPICEFCSAEQHKVEAARELKHQIKRITPQLKKLFYCPICEHEARSYNNIIFKTSSKTEMINHLREKHTSSDIEKVVRD